MDPTQLIAPSSLAGLPAPFWFVEVFKVLGFALHVVPMSIWYAGMVLAVALRWRGGQHGRQLSGRLVKQMPIVVALGVNLGIVPLLFTQVAYYRVFYPATILIAWPWLAIVGILILAYYGVYLYSAGIRRPNGPGTVHRAAGWVSAVGFLLIGFVFANGLSLMTSVSGWPAIWRATAVAGAPTGIALNTGDPTLWPRWLMFFGLALTTAAAWVAVDTAFFAGRESPEYRRWATGFAAKAYTVGLVWFGASGAWYVFGTWLPEPRQVMLRGALAGLTALTALAPGLPWLVLLAQRGPVSRRSAAAIGLSQLSVVALNAVSRQIVQNVELARYLDVSSEAVEVQWSPLALFLVLFVAGLGVVYWMVSRVASQAHLP